MELRKTKKADIEQYRTMGFLIGVVIAMSLLFVTFEFSYGFADDSEELSDEEYVEELDIMPVTPIQDMVALKEEVRETRSEKVVAAEDEVEIPDDAAQEEQGAGTEENGGEESTNELNPEKALSPVAVDKDNPLNFHVVEDLPQFPGGAVEMMKWLTRNLKYPENARIRKKQGRVVAQFNINPDGSVSDIKIIKSVDMQLDSETLRVLKMMPAWKPGIQNGKPCKTRVVVPVWFRL